MVQKSELFDACGVTQRTLTNVIDDTTDCETFPPSDSESESIKYHVPPLDLPSPSDSGRGSAQKSLPLEEVSILLLKMEELNRMNEADERSVSHRSAHSSCSANTTTSSTTATSRSDPLAAGDVSRPTAAASDASSREICTANGVDCTSNDHDDDENIDLWTVWGNLIKSWEIEMKRRPNCIKELVRRGIPQHFRTIAWQLLANANARQVHEQYTEYLRQNSPYEKIILRDIPRTYPESEFFKDGGRGQQSLFNVMKSYSIHDREVGYCQGSAFIVGQLLLQMPEEEAFAVFVRLMEHYRLRELYKPMMTELGLCMFQLEYIVQEQMPDLNMHFNNMGFDTSMYASSWFLTLFTTTLPLELANRIMDLFLVDGMDAIFRIAIGILQQARIDLLKLDMEGMLKYFQREIRERFENDHDLLFTVASRVILNPKRMKKLEKEYYTKRSREQEEAIELRRLRTENRLLRQRIDYLEHESSALADRLVRGQVDLAQQADNCLSISHELNILRDVNSAAHRRLEDAYETIRELSCTDGPTESKSRITVETGVQVDDTAMIEHIHSLQQELIETHSRKSDLENNIRELKLRIHELESANKRLNEASPESGIASLQEELIRIKMREAESTLSLKEMRQRLAEIESQWTKYMQSRYHILQLQTSPSTQDDAFCATSSISASSASQTPAHAPSPSAISPVIDEKPSFTSPGTGSQSPNAAEPDETSSEAPTAQHTQSASQRARERLAKFTASIIGAAGSISAYGSGSTNTDDNSNTFDNMTMTELEDHFMGLKIREADTLAELKEMRQRVMELETQNHVCTNQLKRQDDEMRRIREEKETVAEAEREVARLLKEEQRKLMESQSEMKEKNVMQRLKYTEALQTVADLRQHIAQLESKNAEKFAHAQLRGSSIYDGDDTSSASGHSIAGFCIDDTNSLASEEMSAFLADVTTKASGKNYANDILEEFENGHMAERSQTNCSVAKKTQIKSSQKMEDDETPNEDSDSTTTSSISRSDKSLKNAEKLRGVDKCAVNKNTKEKIVE